jgi:hypothetical protein
MAETAWDYVQGEKHASLYTGQIKWLNKIDDWIKQYPDQIEIIHKNSDDSMLVHIPENWIHIYPPKKETEETKIARSNRMKEYNLKTSSVNDKID